MRLKKYAVTVMDNWTGVHTFWTEEGARKFAVKHDGRVWVWIGYNWAAIN